MTSVMCIEKEWVLKRMYHFEGSIARRDGYSILRDVSRAVMVTIIEGRVVRHDRCMDRYVPHGSRCNDLFSRFEQQTLFLEKLAEAMDPTTDRHGHDGPSQGLVSKHLENLKLGTEN